MYVRKTETIFVLQGNYGDGWEDLTAETTCREIRARHRDYQENDRACRLRVVTRRAAIQ